MIKVPRNIEPSYLSKNKIKLLADLREARSNQDFVKFKKVQDKYNHKTVKNALELMFSGRCAYCEQIIAAVATSHIEHFRPKQRYISLTYIWENLLLSCPKCNSTSYKGTKFPNRLQYGPLIDPSIEDPQVHFDFLYDPVSNLAIVKPLTKRGEITATIFGLNARPDLLKARSEFIRNLLLLKQYDGKDPKITKVLDEVRLGKTQFLAWTKKYI